MRSHSFEIAKSEENPYGVLPMEFKKDVKKVNEPNEAEWIESVCGFNSNCSDNYHCSNCGNTEKFCTRFCSNCGRAMKDHKGFYWRNWL